MTVLVTGGAGFIGSHLTEALLERGDRVVVLDDFNAFYEPARKERNLAAVAGHPSFTLVRGDIRDTSLLVETLARHHVDRVIHLAAWAGVRPSVERPRVYMQNNVEGTQSVLDACVERGVSRLIFASSSSVYGNDSPRPSTEALGADRPLSPYAASKRAGELQCFAAHYVHGLNVTCLRFFTAVGARQRPDLAVHKFARRIAAGERLTLFGDGSSERDYTHVLDIVDGIIAALDRASGYHVINLGAGKPVRLLDVVRTIAARLGVDPVVEHAPMQKGDVDATMADLTQARALLDYAPRRSFESAVADLCDWLEAEGLLR
jgi:UDP-glucuronate 4-epimerase